MKTDVLERIRGFTDGAVERRPRCREAFPVSDLVFVLLTVALFVVLGVVVKGVERL